MYGNTVNDLSKRNYIPSKTADLNLNLFNKITEYLNNM